MPILVQIIDLDLKPVDRGVNKAHGSALDGFFAEHVPGLDRLAQLKTDSAMPHRSAERETELPLRLEPCRIEGVTGAFEIIQHFQEILPDKMFEHETIMQRSAPTHRLALERGTPEPGNERTDQKLLRETHPGVRRHFERTELDEPQAAGRPVRRIQFIDANFSAVGIAAHID